MQRYNLRQKTESYLGNLSDLEQFANLGKQYIFKVGVNEKLASAWVKVISAEAEVIKWTAESRKRATIKDILEKNKPDDKKYIATYSLWSEAGDLAAVSWYQIWEPGAEELDKITTFCEAERINNPIILTSAFRVAADFRKQGLAKKMVTLTELSYSSYLSQKLDASVNIIFTLETDQNNEAAVHTYESNGYQIIGEFDQPDKEPYRGKRLLMVKRHK